MKKAILILLFLIPSLVFCQEQLLLKSSSGNIVVFQGSALSVPKYNDQAQILFDRMPVQLTDEWKEVISDEFDIYDVNGISDKLDNFYFWGLPYAQQVPFNWFDTAHTINIVNDPEFIPNRGFKGAGNEYITLNYNPNTQGDQYALNDAQYGMYSLYDIDDAGVDMGARDPFNALRVSSAGITGTSINTGTFTSGYTTPSGEGMFVVNRKSASRYILLRNGDSVLNVNVASTGIPNYIHYVMCQNNTGIASNISIRGYSHAHYGGSLTNSQNQILYESIKRLNTYAEQFDTIGSFRDLYFSSNLQYKKAYRERANKIIIQASKENLKFGYFGDSLYYSTDTGITYPYKIEFINDEMVRVAHCFSTGEIYFALDNNTAYVSYDSLQTVELLTLYDDDNTPYTLHTPSNASFPGSYYRTLTRVEWFSDAGNEIMTYGNYGNSGEGANPTLIYYVTIRADSMLFKVAEEFGQNPDFRDDGTANGGVTGTLLGDATNFRITRHVHDQQYNSNSDYVQYLCGDASNARVWLRGEYTYSTDVWIFTRNVDSVTASANERFRSLGVVFDGDSVIFGADASETDQVGIWKASIADIDNISGHRRLYLPTANVIYGLESNGDTLIAVNQLRDSILYSFDMGENWSKTPLPDLSVGSYNYDRIIPADYRGYFHINRNGTSLFVKPKENH